MTKYMCKVVTKNYPVTTITPMISRYTQIKKNFNATEIALCLSANAFVTLIKAGGIEVNLTKDNFKTVLLSYNNELAAKNLKAEQEAAAKKNSDVRFIKMIEKKNIKPTLTKTKSIYDFDVYEVDIDEIGERDIGIQGLGWVTFKAEDQAFRIFVPKGVSIYTTSTKVLKKEK